MELIVKSAVEDILRNLWIEDRDGTSLKAILRRTYYNKALSDVQEKLNNFKAKEVDLQKEIDEYMKLHHLHIKDGGRIVFENDDTPNFMCDFRDIAQHFLDLGLSKGGTEEVCKINESTAFDRGIMEEIFPELSESEDEGLRKQILNWFKGCHWDSIDDGTLKRDAIIAWLEKQGEQKPFNDEDNCSKDDAHKTDALICIVKSGGSIRPELRKEFVEWLKSLKQRLQ